MVEDEEPPQPYGPYHGVREPWRTWLWYGLAPLLIICFSLLMPAIVRMINGDVDTGLVMLAIAIGLLAALLIVMWRLGIRALRREGR